MKQIAQVFSHRTLTLFLYLAGVLCLAVFSIAKLHQVIAAELALSTITEQIAQPKKTHSDNMPSTHSSSSSLLKFKLTKPDKSDWSAARKSHFNDTALSKPVGKILIKDINVEAPIFIGDSEINLNKGVAKIISSNQSTYSSNLVIAGHRDSFFRKLGSLNPGANIQITMADGIEYNYQMTEHWIVKPEDTWVMAEVSQDVLTLVTCYPFYFVGSAPKRYIVRAIKNFPTKNKDE